jgi:hypothetical protein
MAEDFSRIHRGGKYMKKVIFLLFLTAALVLAAGALFGQESDLTGTWEGTTYVPNAGDDQVTLVLQKDGETYSGTFTDSMQLANESKLENTNFVDGTLTAEFMIFNGADYIRISLALKVSGELLVGNWSEPSGGTGNLELKRKS